MSDRLRIEFARDMPLAAVEIVAPDLQLVSRTILSAGQSKEVEVPSDRSFLRVHLPEGRVVTLDEPGRLQRFVSRASLGETSLKKRVQRARKAKPAIDDVGFRVSGVGSVSDSDVLSELENPKADGRQHRGQRRLATMRESRVDVGLEQPRPSLGGDTLQLIGPAKSVGSSIGGGATVRWNVEPVPLEHWSDLRYANGGTSITTSIPGSATFVEVHTKRRRLERDLVKVRVRTRSEHADAILAYMSRGDMNSAEALADWAEEAEQMVYHDDSDPYSGVVGAYLLLRLRDFGRMRDWVQQIADRFVFLPDGCVIWAWQLLHTRKGSREDVRRYMFEACRRGLPVYSEGVRLLLDGLYLLDDAGEDWRMKVLQAAGSVVWESPFTTTCRIDDKKPGTMMPAFEVTLAR